jgi:hypothetical protein
MNNSDYVGKNITPPKLIDNISKIIGTGPDTIKIIKNFMPQEDVDIFLNFGKKYAYTLADKTHHNVIDGNFFIQDGLEDMWIKYTDLMRKEAEDIYNLKLNEDRLLDLFVHPEGSYLDAHTDIIDYVQLEVYDQPNLFEEQKKDWPFLWSGHLSILCYLNDDFDGGILYFPDQGIEIVPEPGMFVCFPGNLHFLHGVTKTTGATRFTVSLWTKFSDFENKLM